MARYQGQVAVFRATVPLGLPIADAPAFPTKNVRRAGPKQWQALGIVPSELCSDAEFIRRVSLDITGTLPTPAQTKAFRRPISRSARRWSTDCSTRPSMPPSSRSSGPTSSATSAKGTRSTRPQPITSTTGSARTWPRTRPTTSSSGASWPPAARRRPRRRSSGIAAPRDRRLCGRHRAGVPGHAAPVRQVPSPSVREVGASTTITASPPSSPGSAARRRCLAAAWARRRGDLHDPRGTSAPEDRPEDAAEGAGAEVVQVSPRRPAAEAGGLDGRPREPVLRPAPGESLLGPLLRPGDRRADGRHAADQPAVQSRAARRPCRRLRAVAATT